MAFPLQNCELNYTLTNSLGVSQSNHGKKIELGEDWRSGVES